VGSPNIVVATARGGTVAAVDGDGTREVYAVSNDGLVSLVVEGTVEVTGNAELSTLVDRVNELGFTANEG